MVDDGVFYGTCTVPEGTNNCIALGIFYNVPVYTYKKSISGAIKGYYITYKDSNSTYATEYMFIDADEALHKTTNTLTNPTRTDYTFDGWYKDSNYAGTAFNKNSLSANDFGENGNLTLYAKWEHNNNAHVDENPKNHYCDICDKKITECIDENGDRICDICNTQITAGYIKNGATLLIYSRTDFNSESNASILTGITKIINHGTIAIEDCPIAITEIINCGTITDICCRHDTTTVENKQNGIIKLGIFDGSVTNDGTIESGNFTITRTVTNNKTISGGTFDGTVNNFGTVSGGDFGNAQSTTGIYTVTFDSKGGSDVKTQWRANAPATKPNDPT